MRREDSDEVNLFASLFHGRQDAFGLMQGEKVMAVRRPVSLRHYRLHLEGRLRLGIYPLLSGGVTHFLALDFDGPQAWEQAIEVFHCATHYSLPLAWEISKSGDVHLWLFFSAPALARDARLLARVLLDEAAVRAEVFPKQDSLPGGGLGNFIWLPLSGESVKQGRTLFLDPTSHRPIPNQHGYLSTIEKISPEKLAQVVDLNNLKEDENIYTRFGGTRIFSGYLLPCAKRMLEGVEEGCRDVAAFRLAIHLKSRGYSIKKTEELLQKWNAERNKPPLPTRVISAKIRSAYLRGYSGYGCEDPLIFPFCDQTCPIKQKALTAMVAAEEKAP
jgi:hypothetical protein